MDKIPNPLSSELPARVLASLRESRSTASFNWMGSLYQKHADEEICVTAFQVSTDMYGMNLNEQKTAFYNGMLVGIEVADQLIDSTERDTTCARLLEEMLNESRALAERNYPRNESQQDQASADNMRGYAAIGLQDMIAFSPILYDRITKLYLSVGPDFFSHTEDGFGIIMASTSIVLGLNSL
jgi:hypothetical protein